MMWLEIKQWNGQFNSNHPKIVKYLRKRIDRLINQKKLCVILDIAKCTASKEQLFQIMEGFDSIHFHRPLLYDIGQNHSPSYDSELLNRLAKNNAEFLEFERVEEAKPWT